MKTCSNDECTNKVYARGRCKTHYDKHRQENGEIPLCSVHDCDNFVHSRGLCDTHVRHYNKTGSTYIPKAWHAPWFLGDMYRNGSVVYGCVEWQGATDYRYGVATFPEGHGKVHRAALRRAVGDPPEGKPYALHSCDNTRCYNPAHLRWGSQQENMADMVKRGRGSSGL